MNQFVTSCEAVNNMQVNQLVRCMIVGEGGVGKKNFHHLQSVKPSLHLKEWKDITYKLNYINQRFLGTPRIKSNSIFDTTDIVLIMFSVVDPESFREAEEKVWQVEVINFDNRFATFLINSGLKVFGGTPEVFLSSSSPIKWTCVTRK